MPNAKSLGSCSLSACPFVAGPKIVDPSRFVGRKEELRFLASRMSGSQPISVNVTGEHLTGKSSLLLHFAQTWEQRIDNPRKFIVVYIDLQKNAPKTEAEFYRCLATSLAKLSAVLQARTLRLAPASAASGYRGFVDILDQMSACGMLPVFCLDEFESLLKNTQFGDSFYDQLRGFMNASQLMFVIASCKPLDVHAKERRLTSAFFNLGHLLQMKELAMEEVEELILLPGAKSPAPALDLEERQQARQWGSRHPYRLQLACRCLLEARQSGKSTEWARKQFETQKDRFQKSKERWSWLWLHWLGVVFPMWLGSMPLRLGRIVDDTTNLLVGWALIILCVACMFGWMPWNQLLEWGVKQLGMGK